MFSRIGACIQFEDITTEQKCDIIDKWYTNIVNNLEHDEKFLLIRLIFYHGLKKMQSDTTILEF